MLEGGRLISFASPREICRELAGAPISRGFPTAARIYGRLGGGGEKAPLTVREGRRFLAENCKPCKNELPPPKSGGTPALELAGVHFRYEKHTPDILRGASLSLYEGELFCLLGANGAGKTTVLRAAAGLIKPYRGKVRTFGKRAAMLPQNAVSVFLKNSVREDFEDILAAHGIKKENFTQ